MLTRSLCLVAKTATAGGERDGPSPVPASPTRCGAFTGITAGVASANRACSADPPFESGLVGLETSSVCTRPTAVYRLPRRFSPTAYIGLRFRYGLRRWVSTSHE